MSSVFQVSGRHPLSGVFCTKEGVKGHKAKRSAPTITGKRTVFPKASPPEPVPRLDPTAAQGVVAFLAPSGHRGYNPLSGSMPEDNHGSLIEPPPLLQFPVGFLEASGMKSILSIGPSTRCGSGSSTSWTPTSWTPAASLSRSLTSTASTCAT